MADTISFARGAPSVDIVDIDGLRAAADRAFTEDPAGTTAYGTAVGYLPLRAWIAEQHGVQPENVFVTNGSMQADAFLFDELVTPGTQVVVERPSYDRTLLGLRQRGAELTAISLDDDGLDIDALEAALAGGLSPAFIHVIPNYQNPGGCSLSLAKRERLVALAEQHDFLIFEDDPYRDIRFRGEALPRMYDMAPERTVYACSFSKTVCPGVRVGYLIGAPDLIAKVVERATNTYIAPDMLAQSVVYQFVMSGAMTAAVETVKAALRERCDVLAEALSKHLPEANFVRPDGGYFLWADLPAEFDVDAAAKVMGDYGVAFVKGSDFVLDDSGRSSVRLAYSAVRADQVDEGVQRLADCLRSTR